MSAYQFPELADISQTGAKVSGTSLPANGSTALLRAGELEVLCRVVWVKDNECGLRFGEAVPPGILKQVQLSGALPATADEAKSASQPIEAADVIDVL